MRVHEEEFPIFLTKLTYPSPWPGLAESQITSPTDQSKPLAEERTSLAYLTQPTRSVRTQTPPDAPQLTNQSNFLRGPAATTANEVRSQPNTAPSRLASRPRGAPGVCTTRGGKVEKHLPRSLAVTAPRETTHQLGAVAGPAGARLCLHRLPLWCGLTAPQSRASSVTLLAARSADVTPRSSKSRPLGPLIGQLRPVIDRWAGEIA